MHRARDDRPWWMDSPRCARRSAGPGRRAGSRRSSRRWPTGARMSADGKSERRISRIAGVGVWLLRLLGSTWRYRVVNDAAFLTSRVKREPVIFTLWHGQLLPLLYHHRRQGVSVLISEHGD